MGATSWVPVLSYDSRSNQSGGNAERVSTYDSSLAAAKPYVLSNLTDK